MSSLDPEEEILTESDDGWCELLRRNDGEPEHVARYQAREFPHRETDSWQVYVEKKLTLLRIGGYRVEKDLYFELWYYTSQSSKD